MFWMIKKVSKFPRVPKQAQINAFFRFVCKGTINFPNSQTLFPLFCYLPHFPEKRKGSSFFLHTVCLQEWQPTSTKGRLLFFRGSFAGLSCVSRKSPAGRPQVATLLPLREGRGGSYGESSLKWVLFVQEPFDTLLRGFLKGLVLDFDVRHLRIARDEFV